MIIENALLTLSIEPLRRELKGIIAERMEDHIRFRVFNRIYYYTRETEYFEYYVKETIANHLETYEY